MTNIGIIGAGKIAGVMARTIRLMNEAGNTSVRLYGIASRSCQKAESFARENGVEHAFSSYELMVREPEINLVYIATPHSHHYEHAKLCLAHGKHVLCEKAFTVNASQAKEIVKLAEEKRLLVAEGIWTRYQPMRKIINDIIFSGIVGEAKMLTANLGYELTKKERVMKPELAGGALLDVGVYALNFAEMIFGKADSVHAVCEKNEFGVDVNDSYTLIYEKENRMAVLCASALARSDRYGMIHCTNGYIQVENINNPQAVRVFDASYTMIKELRCPPQLTGYEYEVIESCEAIAAGRTECVSMPHAEIVHMMELMDEIRRQFGIQYQHE